MKRWLKTIRILILLNGLLLIASSSFLNITGNVISENINVGGSILGLIFLVGGLVLFLTEQGTLERIAVYDVSKGKSPEKERFYGMTDPETYFSTGRVNLSEFKRGIKEIEEDKELMDLIKKEYGTQLLDIEKKFVILFTKEIPSKDNNYLLWFIISEDEKFPIYKYLESINN